jgi:2-hydroxy-3-keto-5-methylthiopentenyl-1-phosphate phosphatase
MALKIFVDFDGTITTEDIGDAFFLHFGGEVCRDHVKEYREGRISASECFRREAATIESFTLDEAREFLRQKPLTEGFVEFVRFCREKEIEFHVVSDGLDFYINCLFEQNGLDGISFFSNRLELHDLGDGRYRPTVMYPNAAAECDRCACCKRNILLRLAGDDDIIGYVGEGYSDRCAAQYADIVFAKDDLQRFCQQENISHYLYRDFFDVQSRLEQLLRRKKLRKRRGAELKRRDAIVCES